MCMRFSNVPSASTLGISDRLPSYAASGAAMHIDTNRVPILIGAHLGGLGRLAE